MFCPLRSFSFLLIMKSNFEKLRPAIKLLANLGSVV